MRDFLEMLEDSAEMKLDEMTKGLLRGKFRCDCGKISDLDTAMPSSANPYCTPICGDCFDGAMKEIEEREKVNKLTTMKLLDLRRHLEKWRRHMAKYKPKSIRWMFCGWRVHRIKKEIEFKGQILDGFKKCS